MIVRILRAAAIGALIAATVAVLPGCTTTVEDTAYPAPAVPVAARVTPAPTSTAAPTSAGQLPSEILMISIIRDGTDITPAMVSDTELLTLITVICGNLDKHPSQAGLIGANRAVGEVTGASSYDAGFVVGTAVSGECSRHADLIDN